MDWIQVTAVIGSNIAIFCSMIGLFIWVRTEASSDRRQFLDIINANAKDTNSLINAIKEEIKDFHGILCKIEENRKK